MMSSKRRLQELANTLHQSATKDDITKAAKAVDKEVSHTDEKLHDEEIRTGIAEQLFFKLATIMDTFETPGAEEVICIICHALLYVHECSLEMKSSSHDDIGVTLLRKSNRALQKRKPDTWKPQYLVLRSVGSTKFISGPISANKNG